MKYFRITFFLLFVVQFGFSQIHNEYKISFENAIHHEAQISAVFTNLKSGTISLRMSRTSPGRYALHEFAKNVYNVKITDGKGKDVTVTRPNPHQWDVIGHDGTINISYTLFGDRGDGTYSQINESYALLNIPATFMYIPTLKDRPIKTTVMVRNDLQWKVATQLSSTEKNSFLAPNLQYFMDSPMLISNHITRDFKVASEGSEYTIRLALQHQGTDEEADTYIEQIKLLVEEEKKVFGDYPSFDFGEYTFLAVYMPQVSGDGMEHRNSTVVTSPRSLANSMGKNIRTIAHEFLHAWNVERLRPASLEPFNFEETNISGELWFGEGFTSYYTTLMLCRAGIITEDEYINALSNTYNYVWGSPALQYYNPIEMSYQAPFVDAAKSVDPINRNNTYVSYYSYGNMLGLALDLSLREHKEDLNLDDYMKLLWTKYGKTEIPYTIENLLFTLGEYAGESFADSFFKKYIFASGIPDLKKPLAAVALYLKSSKDVYLGAEIIYNVNGLAEISEYVQKGTPAYEAGLEKGDAIISIDYSAYPSIEKLGDAILEYQTGKKATIIYKRLGKDRKTTVKFKNNPFLEITPYSKPSPKALAAREKWLKTQ